MRFRQKFPTTQIIMALVWIALSESWVHKGHAIAGIRGAYAWVAAGWIFVLVMALAGYFFIWWDITSDSLIERRLWNTKVVPWSEVYRVSPYLPSKKTVGDTLDIEYARAGPLSDRGHIVLLPLERQSFVLALRTHVPQAVFDL
jgi:hypothetical protein